MHVEKLLMYSSIKITNENSCVCMQIIDMNFNSSVKKLTVIPFLFLNKINIKTTDKSCTYPS